MDRATRIGRGLAAVAGLGLLAGCDQGSLLLFGVSFAPWMACAAAGVVIAYALARLLETYLFAYDPRYFVWTFLALTVLCSVVLWNVFARPPPG